MSLARLSELAVSANAQIDGVSRLVDHIHPDLATRGSALTDARHDDPLDILIADRRVIPDDPEADLAILAGEATALDRRTPTRIRHDEADQPGVDRFLQPRRWPDRAAFDAARSEQDRHSNDCADATCNGHATPLG
jgi:hypothetical protein